MLLTSDPIQLFVRPDGKQILVLRNPNKEPYVSMIAINKSTSDKAEFVEEALTNLGVIPQPIDWLKSTHAPAKF